MLCNSLLIDDCGRLWDSRSTVLRSKLHGIDVDTNFVDYAIRNLGYVGIERRSTSAAAIKFRPQTIAPMAFASLMHWLSEQRFVRLLLSTYKERGWYHSLHGGMLPAYLAITEAVRSADRDGNFDDAVLARPANFKLLEENNPLQQAVHYWREFGGKWDQNRSLKELSRILSDRFVLFEMRAGGEFIVRDFGNGMPDCAKSWLRSAEGQRVQDQPDKQYGWSCALAYEASVQRGEPSLQDVDAYVQWSRERQRRRYKRLLLPFMAGKYRPTYLLSATAEDTSIDLRSAIG